MPKRLKENLDYTFSYKDLITVDKMVRKYISDREKMYNELFNSTEDYTVDDLKEYLEYFMSPNASDMDIDSEEAKHHKYLWSIRDFLSRNYEYNLLPSYCTLVGNLTDCLFYLDELVDNITDEGMEEIVEGEYECIENLKKFWNDYLVTMANYPLMNLDKMKHLKRYEIEQRFVHACEEYQKETQDYEKDRVFTECKERFSTDFEEIRPLPYRK